MEAARLVKKGLVNKAQEQGEAKNISEKLQLTWAIVSDWYLEQQAGSQLLNSICPVAQYNLSFKH